MDFVIGVDDFDAFVERFSRLSSENIQIGLSPIFCSCANYFIFLI